MAKNIHELLKGKWEDGTRPKDIYSQRVKKSPDKYVSLIIDGLSDDNRRVQNGCAELASLLSEDHPELLHPYLKVFVEGIKAKEKIIRWEAVCTVGNLARVDQTVVPKLVPKLTPFLQDESIVLQEHTVRALAKIAKVHPRRAGSILRALTEVVDHFPGNKVGFIIEAMEPFVASKSLRPKVKEFVAPYADHEIKVVSRKAKRVLKLL